MSRPCSVFIGFDPREADAFAVTRHSLERNITRKQIPVYGLVLDDLRKSGVYTRPTERRLNSEGRWQLWDQISQHWCATEFSISRFLVPHLARRGLALFMDCDMLVRFNVARLFDRIIYAEEPKAVWCVKHDHTPDAAVKMDGQVQSAYSRKNWSSVMVFDCDHRANRALTADLVNSLPGRDLHRFCWLQDDEIGELQQSWNYLVGHTKSDDFANVVHFTDGSPSMPGYENSEFSQEWRDELKEWARGGLRV